MIKQYRCKTDWKDHDDMIEMLNPRNTYRGALFNDGKIIKIQSLCCGFRYSSISWQSFNKQLLVVIKPYQIVIMNLVQTVKISLLLWIIKLKQKLFLTWIIWMQQTSFIWKTIQSQVIIYHQTWIWLLSELIMRKDGDIHIKPWIRN